jgi:hypothetical protein
MADQGFELDVLRDLLEEAGTIGRLAKNEKAFLAAYEAFRSEDRRAFEAVLKRLRPVPLCRLVCEWIRIKECVFLCFELCGPPPAQPPQVDLRALAEAIRAVTANEKLVAQLVQILEKRDRAAFQRFVKAHKLGPFCHLFCHWLCVVRYRLVCRWLCGPVVAERPNLAAELQTAGAALGTLLEHREAFDAAVAASEAGDAAKLGDVLREFGLLPFCRFICEWFCCLRCVLLCFTLCREFPLKPVDEPLQEALAFGKATGSLAQHPAELERLSAAVGAGDTKTFAALVAKLNLQPHCIQLCHWICFLRCRRFCILVCPPPDTTPLFTHLGIYQIPTLSLAGDFAADGTTNAGRLAFTETIPLSGVMPDGQASQAYEYRFLINENAPAASSPLPAQGPQVVATIIGQLEFWAYDNTNNVWLHDTRSVGVNTSFAPLAIPQPGNTTLPPIDLNVAVGTDGWIPVPRMNDYTQGGIGRFVPGGGLAGTDALINLDTTKFTNENINLGALQGGDSIPNTDLSPRPTYTIRFEARVIGTNPLVATNTLPMIAFCNAHYSYTVHPEWDGGGVTTLTVCSADILELRTGSGCAKLVDTATALFTCYHPYLGSARLYLQGPGIPYPPVAGPFTVDIALPPYGPGAVEAASGLAGHVFNISGLASCAYILHLRTAPNLTTGDGAIGYVDEDLLAFCTEEGQA